MPMAPGTRSGGPQGPSGEAAEVSSCPSPTVLMSVVITQNRPSWWRIVGAKMPALPADEGKERWSRSAKTCPITLHDVRSRLWWTGTPGRYSKVEVIR